MTNTSTQQEQSPAKLETFFKALTERPSWRWTGKVVQANGQTVVSEGPLSSVGEGCELIDSRGYRHPGEIIGFNGASVVSMPLKTTEGLRYGDRVQSTGSKPSIGVSDQMQGRILNAVGEPLDGMARPRVDEMWPFDGCAPASMDRKPIREPLQTGVRVIDGLLTVGRGQRVGIFGGSGVGKSTLIGMMTRNTEAEITVVGLVGERGREVREFVDEALGPEGLKRSVVFVSTSDESPLLRLRAASASVAVAEYYARQGKHVLLILDSLTRYAMAAREVGLAAGEPPASKGYTPSVFSRLAKLLERAGSFECGSITAFYTVLMEGDDQQDPIVDAVRSLLDGHVVLSREKARAGHYPPIEVLDSLSRLMPAVTTEEHRGRAQLARSLMASYARGEDLLKVGAYKHGLDKELDRAVNARSPLLAYCAQRSDDPVSLPESIEQLRMLSL